MTTPVLTSRTLGAAAARRSAASSVAARASASRFTHLCVTSNANASRRSRSESAISSEGGR